MKRKRISHRTTSRKLVGSSEERKALVCQALFMIDNRLNKVKVKPIKPVGKLTIKQFNKLGINSQKFYLSLYKDKGDKFIEELKEYLNI